MFFLVCTCAWLVFHLYISSFNLLLFMHVSFRFACSPFTCIFISSFVYRLTKCKKNTAVIIIFVFFSCVWTEQYCWNKIWKFYRAKISLILKLNFKTVFKYIRINYLFKSFKAKIIIWLKSINGNNSILLYNNNKN